MAIEFRCGSCQKKLKVKDELAGKRIKCPACSTPIEVPEPEDPNKKEGDSGPGSTETIINVNLGKFKHKEFDLEEEDSGELEALEGAVAKRSLKMKAVNAPPPSVPLQPIDWVLSVLCVCAAFIYAIVLMVKGQSSRGKKLLLLSLGVSFLLTLIGVLFVMALSMGMPK